MRYFSADRSLRLAARRERWRQTDDLVAGQPHVSVLCRLDAHGFLVDDDLSFVVTRIANWLTNAWLKRGPARPRTVPGVRRITRAVVLPSTLHLIISSLQLPTCTFIVACCSVLLATCHFHFFPFFDQALSTSIVNSASRQTHFPEHKVNTRSIDQSIKNIPAST